MQAVTLGFNHQHPAGFAQLPPSPPGGMAGAQSPPALDAAQLQQLVHLLDAKMLPKQTAVVECPKSMVGRVIGKGGETIKALQQYTGAMIQIDQSTDPTRVTIAGSPQSLQLAVSMVNDIVRGTFKGFAMLRQIAISTSQQAALGQFGQPTPVYVQGYGFVPPSQVFSPEDALAASLLRTSPTGPLTPPMTPLRVSPQAPAPGGLVAEALAALLAQQGAQQAPPPQPSQEALLSQLMQLAAAQQAPPAPRAAYSPPPGPSAADVASLQALLAQTNLLGGGPPPRPASSLGAASPPPGPDAASSGLMAGSGGAASLLGTAPAPPFGGCAAAADPAQTHRAGSPGGSPLGRFGPIGSRLAPASTAEGWLGPPSSDGLPLGL